MVEVEWVAMVVEVVGSDGRVFWQRLIVVGVIEVVVGGGSCGCCQLSERRVTVDGELEQIIFPSIVGV